jgi:indole-3-glycerol phosphate synthase
MNAGTYLENILRFHRDRAKRDTRSFDHLLSQAQEMEDSKDFISAIKASSGLSVIAEIKRRSPSKGDLNRNLDPGAMAAIYETAGASCISVLTDTEFFAGSSHDLSSARLNTKIPILRKDFTVDKRDICDARIMGANCVLLIVSALTDDELVSFIALATELGIAALVETHDEKEVGRALNAGANLIGVNQRDLYTFEVDQERAVRVIREIPNSITKVAESGIRNLEEATVLAEAGYDAVLIGEAFVKSSNPSSLISSFSRL